MKRPPLSPGDRVRVRNGTGNFRSIVGKGKITGEVMGLGGNRRCFNVLIERKDGRPWHNYRAWENQCTRLRPKPRKQEKRENRVHWVLRNPVSGSSGAFFTSKQEAMQTSLFEMEGWKLFRLVELDSDEIPVSRKDLARAWEKVAPIGYSAFPDLCRLLGFPEEKK